MKESALLTELPTLTIPGVLSWKNHKQVVRMGDRVGLIKSKRAREWSEMAVLALRAQWAGRQPITTPVEAFITVYVPSERSPLDLDNAIGGPLDMLAAAEVLKHERNAGGRVINAGDWLIRQAHIAMCVDKKNPRVEIGLREIGRWPVEKLL